MRLQTLPIKFTYHNSSPLGVLATHLLPSHTGTALVPACQNKLAENFAIFINRKLAG